VRSLWSKARRNSERMDWHSHLRYDRSPKPFQPNSSSCMHIPLEKRVLLLCHFDCPNVRVACSSTRIPRNAAIPSFSPAQALGSDIARCFPTVLFLTYIGARLKLTFEITVLLADWTFGGILVSTEFANRLWNFHSRRGFLFGSIF